MHILRLGNSADTFPGVPEEARSASITARAVEAATGEPVETTFRHLWPAEELPDLIESWIGHYQPDFVIFWVNGYWFTYVELPEARRSNRGIVKAAGRFAAKARLKKALVYRVGKVRRQVQVWRGVGREFFEPEDIIALNESVIRRVLQHEEVSLIVRGPVYPNVTILNRSMLARGEVRRRIVHRALEALCAQLHVPYIGEADGLAYIGQKYLCDDGLHPNEKAHLRLAAEETEELLKIWRASGRTGTGSPKEGAAALVEVSTRTGAPNDGS